MNTAQSFAVRRAASARRLPSRLSLVSLAVSACFAFGTVQAMPSGANVVAGSAQIKQSGNKLTVTNSPGAIINWSNFSVGAIETVKFQQQNSLSSVLNRVTGTAASDIQGSLLSNGRVYLINPNGILFGPNSTINVNGLIASTLDISNQDFTNGKLNFSTSGNAGNLKNAGVITAAQNIYLIAPDIENTGILKSDNGEIILAAGRQVTLVDGAHPDIQIVVSAPADKALNLGDLSAGRISIFGALIQQKGRINADRAEVDDKGRIVLKASKQLELDANSQTTANGKQGGEILLQTNEGNTYVKGTVEATGSKATGGTISALGQRVAVMDSASMDASGETGGGRIMVGGDYQGKNASVQNSTVTYFGPDATLKANANSKGDGGAVIVWANDTTRAYGSIEAKGGSKSGNGGFVETSGKGYLDFNAKVDTTASNGDTGTLLLDPMSITIGMTADINGDATTGDDVSGGILDTDYSGAASLITAGQVGTLLGSSSLSLAATNTITVNSPISWSSAYPLSLSAGFLSLNDSITNSGVGGVTLTATGGSIDLAVSKQISSAGNIDLTAAGTITTGTGSVIQGDSVTLTSNSGGYLYLYGSVISSATGSVSITNSASGYSVINADISHSGGLIKSNTINLNILTGNIGNPSYSLATSAVTPATDTTTFNIGNTQTPNAVYLNHTGKANIQSFTLSNASNPVTITASKDLTLSTNLSGGTVNLTSTNGAIIDGNGGSTNITPATSLTLSASGSIGTSSDAIETSGSPTLTISNSGGVFIDHTGAMTLGGGSSTDKISIASTGAIAEGASGLSATSDIVLKTSNSLDLYGDVTSSSGNVVYTADSISFGSTTTTGSKVKLMPYTTTNGIAVNTGSGVANALNLAASDLNSSRIAATTLILGDDTNMTGGIAVTTALTGAAGFFTNLGLMSNGGAITQTVPITLPTGGTLGVKGGTVTLTATVSGGNGVDKLVGQSTAGDFSYTNASRTLTVVAPSGDFTSIASGGVAGSAITTLTTTGSGDIVTGSGATVDGGTSVTLASAGGIGTASATPLKTTTPAVTATASSGSIWMKGHTYAAPAELVVSASTSTGNIEVDNNGDLSVGTVNAGSGTVQLTSTLGASGTAKIISNSSSITGSTISLNANGDIGASGAAMNVAPSTAVNATSTTGSVYLSGSGGLPIGTISATGTAKLTSSLTITDTNGSSNNITASALDITAYSGIASSADPLETQVSTLAAVSSMSGGIYINNTSAALTITGASAQGDVSLTSSGSITASGAITSYNGNVGLTTGAGSALTANANISASSGTVSITAGSLGGSGTITDATHSNVAASSFSFTNNTPIVTPTAPTLEQCIADKTLSGCAAVLPSLATCTSTPATAGCSVVLPSIATCTATPSAAGCSAVLPSLATCTVTPATAGCSAVLPSLATCTAAPTAAGCSAVLPTLAACTDAPTTAGCSAVLPTIADCSSNLSLPGCTAVMPSLTDCLGNSGLPGCSAVLATINSGGGSTTDVLACILGAACNGTDGTTTDPNAVQYVMHEISLSDQTFIGTLGGGETGAGSGSDTSDTPGKPKQDENSETPPANGGTPAPGSGTGTYQRCGGGS